MKTVDFRRDQAGTVRRRMRVVECPVCGDGGVFRPWGSSSARVVHELVVAGQPHDDDRHVDWCEIELPRALPLYSDSQLSKALDEQARVVGLAPIFGHDAERRARGLAAFKTLAGEAVRRGLVTPPGVVHSVEAHIEERARNLRAELDRWLAFGAECRREVNAAVAAIPMPGSGAEGDGA
jgi:hypothetical protein